MKELKNGRSGLLACDGELLKNVIKANGYTPTQLAELMNYGSGYFTRCIRKNTIGKNAVEKLKEYKIMPAQYRAESIESLQKTVKRLKEDKEIMAEGGLEKAEERWSVGDILDSLPEETKNEVYSEAEKAIDEANHVIDTGLKRNSGRYPWGESEKAPVEKALEEPGVVKIELTLDMVKLKAIVKAAVKEAYEEL